MAILYYDEKKLFQLNTENTTYVIGLSPEGYVGHVYYGPLLHGEPDLYPLRMDEPPFTPSVNKREKSSFLDRFPMEYPTGGVGDYRESCLNIRNAQGRMGCEIFFDSYEIFKGKRPLTGLPASFGTEDEVETLEITCKDPVLDLVVVLSYSVFTKENVITRSVRVKNEGSEALKVEKSTVPASIWTTKTLRCFLFMDPGEENATSSRVRSVTENSSFPPEKESPAIRSTRLWPW